MRFATLFTAHALHSSDSLHVTFAGSPVATFYLHAGFYRYRHALTFAAFPRLRFSIAPVTLLLTLYRSMILRYRIQLILILLILRLDWVHTQLDPCCPYTVWTTDSPHTTQHAGWPGHAYTRRHCNAPSGSPSGGYPDGYYLILPGLVPDAVYCFLRRLFQQRSPTCRPARIPHTLPTGCTCCRLLPWFCPSNILRQLARIPPPAVQYPALPCQQN